MTDPAAPRRPRGRPRLIWLLLGVACLAVIVAGASAVVLTGEDDADHRPSGEPGALAAATRWDGELAPGTSGWRIDFDTERWNGEATPATGLVLAADDWDGGPRPLLVWAHGTSGIAEECGRTDRDLPFDAQSPIVAELAARGWVVVAPDYAGLGSPGPHGYLVGEAAAHDLLNAARAAGHLDGLELSGRTLLWGLSQGGHAALWAAALAPGYAPEIDLLGVAAVAPPADLTGLKELSLDSEVHRLLVAYLLGSWHETYPDSGFWEALSVADRTAVTALTQTCAGSVLTPPAESLDPGVLSDEVLEAGLDELLSRNSVTDPIDVPVLVVQGAADDVVLESLQREWVDSRCARGQALDYRVHDGLDHHTILGEAGAAEEIIGWAEDRLAGTEPTPTCT